MAEPDLSPLYLHSARRGHLVEPVLGAFSVPTCKMGHLLPANRHQLGKELPKQAKRGPECWVALMCSHENLTAPQAQRGGPGLLSQRR